MSITTEVWVIDDKGEHHYLNFVNSNSAIKAVSILMTQPNIRFACVTQQRTVMSTKSEIMADLAKELNIPLVDVPLAETPRNLIHYALKCAADKHAEERIWGVPFSDGN